MFKAVPAAPVHRGAAQCLQLSRGEEHWRRSCTRRGRTAGTADPIGHDRHVVLLKNKKKNTVLVSPLHGDSAWLLMVMLGHGLIPRNLQYIQAKAVLFIVSTLIV